MNTIRANGLIYGVGCTPRGDVIATSGSLDTLQWKDLHDRLFGSSDDIVRLYASLEGKILPRSFNQGDVFCILHKPAEGLLVGLFGQAAMDPHQRYAFREKVARHIEKCLVTGTK